jgi:copper chaperone CopZ
MKEQKFQVSGMHCKSCEMLIKEVLEDQEGVQNVDVSSKEGMVKVFFDETLINKAKIQGLIEEEGYKVKKG